MPAIGVFDRRGTGSVFGDRRLWSAGVLARLGCAKRRMRGASQRFNTRTRTPHPILCDGNGGARDPSPTKGERCEVGALDERLLFAAVSIDRRNTVAKSLCRGVEVQRFSWPLVEAARDAVELGLRVRRQIGFLRKILAQQSIGVFV